MDILGIGPMELLLILIVALMVFGPDKLPQIGAKLGKGMREMRRATRAISEEINNTRAAVENPARELAEPLKDVKDVAKAAGNVVAAARNPSAALRESVLKELNTPVQPKPQPDATPTQENTIAPPALIAPAEAPVAQLPAISETLAAASEESTPPIVLAGSIAQSSSGEEAELLVDAAPPAPETDTLLSTRTPPEQ